MSVWAINEGFRMLHDCWGSLALYQLADTNLESTAADLQSYGLSQDEARKLARTMLAGRAPRGASARVDEKRAQQAKNYYAEIEELAPKNPDGTVSHLGRFWQHCIHARDIARVHLAALKLPVEPGKYFFVEGEWRLEAPHSWRLHLEDIEANSTGEVAASLCSLACLSLKLLQARPFDVGEALDLAFHMGEVHIEFLIRRVELFRLASIGLKVSQKGIYDAGIPKGDRAFEAYLNTQPLMHPNAFAREHYLELGFPTSAALQKALSRRLRPTGTRPKKKRRRR